MVQRTSYQIFSLRNFCSLVIVPHLRVPAVHAVQYNRDCAVFGISAINWTDSTSWRLLHCAVLLWMRGRVRDRRLPDDIGCFKRNKMDGWLA